MGCGLWVVVGIIQAPLSVLVLPPSWACGRGLWVVGCGLWVVMGVILPSPTGPESITHLSQMDGLTIFLLIIASVSYNLVVKI